MLGFAIYFLEICKYATITMIQQEGIRIESLVNGCSDHLTRLNMDVWRTTHETQLAETEILYDRMLIAVWVLCVGVFAMIIMSIF